MEKRIILDGKETPFWLEDTGRLRNEKTHHWLKGEYKDNRHFYSLYFKGKKYIIYPEELFGRNPNEELAQFKNTPYYATRDGRIFNMSANIEKKLFPIGDYLGFKAAYGINKKLLVHRVVWEAFNGPIPKNKGIGHIDGNTHNNSLDNLQIY